MQSFDRERKCRRAANGGRASASRLSSDRARSMARRSGTREIHTPSSPPRRDAAKDRVDDRRRRQVSGGVSGAQGTEIQADVVRCAGHGEPPVVRPGHAAKPRAHLILETIAKILDELRGDDERGMGMRGPLTRAVRPNRKRSADWRRLRPTTVSGPQSPLASPPEARRLRESMIPWVGPPRCSSRRELDRSVEIRSVVSTPRPWSRCRSPRCSASDAGASSRVRTGDEDAEVGSRRRASGPDRALLPDRCPAARAGSAVPIDTFLEELEVSRATFKRDLEYLP